MDTPARLAELKQYAEDQADIINENLCNAFTQLMREQVADWQRRYPRHRFRVWEGHGMISTDISPPLGWDKSNEWEEIEYCRVDKRGAIATLMAEALAIHEAFNDLDIRVQFMVSETIGEPL